MSGSNEKLRVLRRIPEIRFDEELRGYNKHQVDRVLENLAPLADEVDVLVDRLGEAERRAAAAEARVMEGGGPAPTQLPASEPVPQPEPTTQATAVPAATENFDETLSKTLLLAQRTADATVQEANEEAARITAEAEAEVAATREALEQEAVSMRAAAADERSAAVEQANREVAAMIEAARTTIDTKVAEAEAELASSHAATRDGLIEQIASLQRARDGLALDVEHFEGHLTSRRNVIRAALSELAEVVEHPERLRTVMPPTPLAEVPDVNAGEPTHIDVVSLDTLATAVTADAEAQGVLSPDLGVSSEVGAWAEDGNSWAEVVEADEDVSVDSPSVEDAATQGTFDSAAGDGLPADERLDEALSSGVLVDPGPAEIGATDGFTIEGGQVDAPGGISDAFAPDAGIDEPTQALPAIDPVDLADEGSSDPFLDELRRATSDDDNDEALSKFLSDADGDDGKSGWFGRRK